MEADGTGCSLQGTARQEGLCITTYWGGGGQLRGPGPKGLCRMAWCTRQPSNSCLSSNLLLLQTGPKMQAGKQGHHLQEMGLLPKGPEGQALMSKDCEPLVDTSLTKIPPDPTGVLRFLGFLRKTTQLLQQNSPCGCPTQIKPFNIFETYINLHPYWIPPLGIFVQGE